MSLEERRAAVGELSRVEPDQLDRDIDYQNTKGIEFRNPLADILQHLVTRSAYHRGQIAAVVRQAGGVPAPADYIVYVCQHAAAGQA